MNNYTNHKMKFLIFLRTFILIFFTISILSFPNVSFDAGKEGFVLWTTVVFPALLPFFVLSELLIQYGIVRFLGVFLEPIIKPLFKVRGVGGIIFVLSMVSGFPNGARMACQLYTEGGLTKDEAERISTFSNFSNPIFIIGAVSIGMFNSVRLGIVLLVVHILSNIFVAIIIGLGKKIPYERSSYKGIIQQEWVNWMTVSKEKVTFGTRFSNSVRNSVQTLLIIGGLIMVFSVMSALLKATYITPTLAICIQKLFPIFKIEYIESFCSGLLEVTIGLKELSEISHAPLFIQVLLASMLLAFNGFSVHAQVLSFLTTQNLSYGLFFYGRVLQALISSVIVLLFYKPFIEPFLLSSTVQTSLTITKNIPISSILIQTHFLYIFTFVCILAYAAFEIKRLLRTIN